MLDPPEGEGGKVFRGVMMSFAMHAGALIFGIVLALVLPQPLSAVFLGLVMMLGVSQFLYMVPAIVIHWRRGERAIAKGLVIGAAIAFILSAACWEATGLSPEEFWIW